MTTQERNEIMKEIEATNAKLQAVKTANSVDSGKASQSRKFTYRKQTIVTGLEAVQ